MGVMINFSSWEWPFLITIIPMWLFNQFVITTILTWCCEHENKIKHKYLVDKKPRYQLRPHKTAPRLTCDLCEWLAMEPTLLRPNIRPCCEFIRSPMVAQLLRLFLTVKNTRKTFPTNGEWVRVCEITSETKETLLRHFLIPMASDHDHFDQTLKSDRNAVATPV